jgi:Protein of unknown function (DUF4229)
MLTPFLRYTLLRILVLLATAALLALAGLRGLALLAVAVLVSGFVSLVVLRGTRDDVSRAIVARRAGRGRGAPGAPPTGTA